MFSQICPLVVCTFSLSQALHVVIIIINILVSDAFHVGILQGLDLNFAYRFQNAFITIDFLTHMYIAYSNVIKF